PDPSSLHLSLLSLLAAYPLDSLISRTFCQCLFFNSPPSYLSSVPRSSLKHTHTHTHTPSLCSAYASPGLKVQDDTHISMIQHSDLCMHIFVASSLSYP